jgi:hypothetical protein
MGWYLRKSFGIGPLRLNLSKSGLGLSAGVKGLRIGTGPRGTYLHGGREGLYYRKSLESPGKEIRPEREANSEIAEIQTVANRNEQADSKQETKGSTFWSALWRGIFGGLMRGR